MRFALVSAGVISSSSFVQKISLKEMRLWRKIMFEGEYYKKVITQQQKISGDFPPFLLKARYWVRRISETERYEFLNIP